MTIKDLMHSIECNSEDLKGKSAIELDTKFSDKDLSEMYNKLYADDSVKLVMNTDIVQYSTTKFQIKIHVEFFDIIPEFVGNSITRVNLLEMKYHFEALKKLVKIANAINGNSKIENYRGKPFVREFKNELDRLMNKGIRYNTYTFEGLELGYMEAVETITAEEFLNNEELFKYIN